MAHCLAFRSPCSRAAWWEYEEALTRLAYDLKAEAAGARATHTRDLGILLQQQLLLRGRVDELQAALEQSGGGGGDGGGGRPVLGATGSASGERLASSVMETAKDAAELQLALLERGAASLRLEAEAARAEAEEARSDAAGKASQIAALHTQLASATRRLKRLDGEAEKGIKPPKPPKPLKPQPPDGGGGGGGRGGGGDGAGGNGGGGDGGGAAIEEEVRALKAEILSQSAENGKLRARLVEAERRGGALDDAEASRAKWKKRAIDAEGWVERAAEEKEVAVAEALAGVAERAHFMGGGGGGGGGRRAAGVEAAVRAAEEAAARAAHASAAAGAGESGGASSSSYDEYGRRGFATDPAPGIPPQWAGQQPLELMAVEAEAAAAAAEAAEAAEEAQRSSMRTPSMLCSCSAVIWRLRLC